jgi:hypothetical protein
MIENGDFRFRDDMFSADSGETLPIEILTGPFKNVIFKYVKVGVKEKDDETAVLQFTYDLLEMGNHTETYLRKDPKFTQHLGILLNHLILETQQGLEKNESRKNDTEEFVDE